MRISVSSLSGVLLSLIVLVLALALLVTPGAATAAQPASIRTADGVVTEVDQGEDGVTATSSEIQRNLASLTEVQTSARSRLSLAREESTKIAAKLKRNKKRVAKARRVVSLHMRSMYINGPTELTTLASIIDTRNLGDLIKKADVALRVGEHKDDQYDQAVGLLKRSEEAKKASDAALEAAKDSLTAVDDQVNALTQRRADVAGELAGRIESSGSVQDAEQAARNSNAALAWADYLGQLADSHVPTVTAAQLKKAQKDKKAKLPKHLSTSKKQPGVAFFRKGGQRVVVLPEQTIAAVTYAVSRLGSEYRWKANTATEMDCSALVDRSWNVPALDAEERKKERELVPGGVRGLARTTSLVDASDRHVGDLAFLSDAGAGVNHVGIVVTGDLMIASDSTTGAVNALPINEKRLWRAGRMAMPAPKQENSVPKANRQAFQCGADPESLISLPDGKVLGNAKLCPPATGVFSEAHMQPPAILAARCAAQTWPQILSIGGWRPADSYPDHPSGRAIDIMIPDGCSMSQAGVRLGDTISEFFMKNSDKFNVEYIIWRQRMWNVVRDPKQAPEDWRTMGDRGDCTSNHMDHVHITLKGPNVSPDVVDEPEPEPDNEDTSDSTS